jgi:hypothetical protein
MTNWHHCLRAGLSTSRPDRVAWALLVAGAAAGAGPLLAQGGPPLETDDPGTPGPGRLELNLSLEAEREEGGTGYDLPRVDANFGVGTRVQLKLEVPWRVRTSALQPARTGPGNAVLGVKWRFAETGDLAVAVYPQVTLEGIESSRANGLADSGTAMLFPIEVAWVTGPLSLGTEVGYESSPGDDEMVYGLAVALEARPSLELLSECHGSAAADLTEAGMLCGAGFRWALQPSAVALVALEAGVAGPVERRPDHRLYAGAQLVW